LSDGKLNALTEQLCSLCSKIIKMS